MTDAKLVATCDQARAVYNAMINKYPAAIGRCLDTADVIACVRFAREHGVEIAVRGGGHNALRGGGGNFGVVTSFTFACHDIGEHGAVIGGPVFYDLADAAEVMRWYRDLLPSLPEELSGWLALLTIPPAPSFPADLHGRKACAIVWCYTGPHDRADEVLAPVATFGTPLLDGIHPMPFTALQSAFDPLIPAGLQWYWKADFFTESPTRLSTCTWSTAI